MGALFYPAIIEKTATGYAVSFPDLACGGAGETLDEAVRDAEQGLDAHLDAMRAEGQAPPEPTPINKVKAEKDVDEVARIIVRYEPPGQSIRLNITMDEILVKRVDAAAERLGFTRSGFLAEAARRYIVSMIADGAEAAKRPASAPHAKEKPSRGAKTGAFREGTQVRKLHRRAK